MADIADEASDLQEQLLNKTLHQHSIRREIPFSGLCLNCEEKIEIGRYCDQYCREDHENRIRKRR